MCQRRQDKKKDKSRKRQKKEVTRCAIVTGTLIHHHKTASSQDLVIYVGWKLKLEWWQAWVNHCTNERTRKETSSGRHTQNLRNSPLRTSIYTSSNPRFHFDRPTSYSNALTTNTPGAWGIALTTEVPPIQDGECKTREDEIIFEGVDEKTKNETWRLLQDGKDQGKKRTKSKLTSRSHTINERWGDCR